MESRALKRDFGRDLVFWGGGVDTQGVFQHGTPVEVREDVERHIRDLQPGGGFIFAAIHNIQATVPARNLLAMWEAVTAFGDDAGEVATFGDDAEAAATFGDDARVVTAPGRTGRPASASGDRWTSSRTTGVR
jgi:hypothetical protein